MGGDLSHPDGLGLEILDNNYEPIEDKNLIDNIYEDYFDWNAFYNENHNVSEWINEEGLKLIKEYNK